MPSDYTIRVLQRAAEVLKCFTSTEPEKTLMELSRKTGLHKSTVFRIMETLKELQWVRHDTQTGLYRLGFGLFELGSITVNGLDLYKASRSHLESLVRETGHTVHLVIYDHGEALYLSKLEFPGSFISQPSGIGLRMPLHCTAVGKVLAAFTLNEDDLDQVIKEKGLRKITDNTITDRERLLEVLVKVRNEGYAVDDEEIQVGLRCIAAPITNHKGEVIAACSVSGLISSFSDEKLPALIEQVTRTSRAISADLGYNGLNYLI